MVDVGDSDMFSFREKVFSWYEDHKRVLPWRETHDPYKILISEVMSQQTQVSRVLEFYHRWFEVLPSLHDLAAVDTKTLLSLWSGLGYNNRALRLRELARIVVEEYNGLIPDSYDDLVALPGIGDYTASAVLAFAFHRVVAVVDTNIRRVFIDEFSLDEDISLVDLKEVVLKSIPEGKVAEWYNALMDYGALHKTSRKTGIRPLSRQGKFVGSSREVRGFILRELSAKNNLNINVIKKKFSDRDVNAIINKLIHEGTITKNRGIVKLV